jgi:hypothetical protein
MKINAFADVSLRAIMVLAAVPDGGLLTGADIRLASWAQPAAGAPVIAWPKRSRLPGS